jgi:dimethylhistidine N-methyltransferase
MQNNTGDTTIPDCSEGILNEIIQSLGKSQKELSCKFFYDERGSMLFEQISELEEYYLTRAEISILNNNIKHISDAVGEKVLILELGSGSSRKIRILLDNFKSVAAYIPVDISREFLLRSSGKLSKEYSDLKIIPIVADYTKPFTIPEFEIPYSKIVAYYPGSTIGNFTGEQAHYFLKNIAGLCGINSGLLIGIDLKKESEILEKAYNDGKGITAQFNLNILKNMNSSFGTNFEINKWKHKAFYNEEHGRVEMHLQSLEEQSVRVNGTSILFKKDETIHTENSYKYSIEEFEKMIDSFYSLKNVWSDPGNKFAVCYFEAK